MQTMLLDFVPVLLFLIAFKIAGIYVATTVGIVATAIQVFVTRLLRKKFDNQQLVTLLVFVVFGGMTLYFHNPIFVKWKPTIVFWVFGLAFLGSQFIGKKPIVQRMLEKVLEDNASLPRSIWTRLNIAWAMFFIILGSLNLFVAYHFDTDVWVNFKVYGIMGILLLFSFIQALFLSRFLTEGKH